MRNTAEREQRAVPHLEVRKRVRVSSRARARGMVRLVIGVGVRVRGRIGVLEPHLEVCVLECDEELAQRTEQHGGDGRSWLGVGLGLGLGVG